MQKSIFFDEFHNTRIPVNNKQQRYFNLIVIKSLKVL